MYFYSRWYPYGDCACDHTFPLYVNALHNEATITQNRLYAKQNVWYIISCLRNKCGKPTHQKLAVWQTVQTQVFCELNVKALTQKGWHVALTMKLYY